MFGKGKTIEEKEIERKQKEEEKRVAQRRNTLMNEVKKYVKQGWSAGDVDAKEGTATLTRATTSMFRKVRRAATLSIFSAAEADRTETMFIYLNDKGKPEVSKSRRGIITK